MDYCTRALWADRMICMYNNMYSTVYQCHVAVNPATSGILSSITLETVIHYYSTVLYCTVSFTGRHIQINAGMSVARPYLRIVHSFLPLESFLDIIQTIRINTILKLTVFQTNRRAIARRFTVLYCTQLHSAVR